MPKFSIEEAFSFGWKTVKEQWTTLVPVVILFWFVGGMFSNAIAASTGSPAPSIELTKLSEFPWRDMFSGGSAQLLSFIVSSIASGILYFISLKYLSAKKQEFKNLFKGLTPEYLLKVMGASILQALAVVVGLVLLIVPGIYLALRFSQVVYVIADTNCGIMDAFRESSRLTEGVKWNLLGFFFVAMLILILGMLVFFVGIVVAAPVVLVAAAHVYNQLKKSAGKGAVAAEA